MSPVGPSLEPSSSAGTGSDPSNRPPDLAEAVVSELRRRGETVAVAESCTGGLLGGEITRIVGSSKVFWGGVIAYDNAAKTELLAVDGRVLERRGAVSEQAAREMAVEIRSRAATTWGVSVTGVAGPDGGSSEKPVGTVWIAVDGPRRTTARFRFTGDRAQVRRQAVEAALDRLRGTIVGAEK